MSLIHPRRWAAALLTVFACAAPSSAHAVQLEQFNRVDGVAGIAPLVPTSVNSAVLTDDGRFAYFTFEGVDTEWAPANGLYRRDLLTNRTVRLAAGYGFYIVSLNADDSAISFISEFKSLVAADTNGRADLYRYTAATGAIDVISRADGVAGTPAGVQGGAFLTRGGRYALFANALGVYRRDVAAGTTVRVGDGAIGRGPGYFAPAAQASADGSVYVDKGELVTRAGRVPLLTGNDYGQIEVDEAGSIAFVTRYNGPDGLRSATVYKVATGTRTTVTLPSAGDAFGFPALDPSGGAARYSSGGALRSIDLATRATRSLGFAGVAGGFTPTRTARFAITSLPVRNVVLAAVAPDGSSLPGGADPLSTAPYLSFVKGCAKNVFGQSRSPAMYVRFTPAVAGVPAATSITLAATTPAGAKIGEKTFTANGSTGVAVGTATWKLTTTIRLVDGRTISETRTMPGIASNDYCPGPSI